MNLAIAEPVSQIRCMEEALEVQLALARADLHLRIDGGKTGYEPASAARSTA